MYTWEVLTWQQFEQLIVLKDVRPEQVAPISNHWLTGGEIWSLCGLDKYGRVAVSSRNAPFQQSVATTAGGITALPR